MKIFIDIGHPAHVHYLRNFIKVMESHGHKFLVFARNKEFVHDLLNFYSIKFIDRGKGNDSQIGKFFYMFTSSTFIFFKSIIFSPNIFISISSPYLALASLFFGKPHFALNDTEHVHNKNKIFVYPFSNVIITPSSFQDNLGVKQVKINTVFESFYLHKAVFNPDKSILDQLNIMKGEHYVIIRLVGWTAHHDRGHSGIKSNVLRRIIELLLENNFKIFISSEKVLEKDLRKYKINIEPQKMHDVIAYSSMFIGESATMASESAYLGIPCIYINSLPLMGYLKLEQDFGILKHFSSSEGVLKFLTSQLKNNSLAKNIGLKRDEMLAKFINPTEFLVWFTENYPESNDILRKNPNYQSRFIREAKD